MIHKVQGTETFRLPLFCGKEYLDTFLIQNIPNHELPVVQNYPWT
jgi:hypothetical protein